LRRAGLVLDRTDWYVVSFAVMSSHIHWGAISGSSSFEDVAKPLHAGFASWLNRRQHRFGPVFAERPKTVVLDTAAVGRLIAYQHNNPSGHGSPPVQVTPLGPAIASTSVSSQRHRGFMLGWGSRCAGSPTTKKGARHSIVSSSRRPALDRGVARRGVPGAVSPELRSRLAPQWR